MAKEREQKMGFIMYVEQGKPANEICKIIGVSEATFSKWVNKNGWREQRNARISQPTIRIENIRSIMNDLSEERISLMVKLKELEQEGKTDEVTLTRKQIAQVDDAVSKWNKTLENITKDSQISLSIYLNVMEKIFDAIRAHDEKMYYSLLEFQEQHLAQVSSKYL
jgi:transposase